MGGGGGARVVAVACFEPLNPFWPSGDSLLHYRAWACIALGRAGLDPLAGSPGGPR